MRHALPFVALLPCALFALPARPCSISEPFLAGPAFPTDGAVAVPTNGKVHISLDNGFVDFRANLLAEGAEPVSLATTRDEHIATVDLGELAPQTAYTIEIVADARFEGDVASAIEPIGIVTADGADDEPPTVRGVPEVTVEHVPGTGPFEATSCGPSRTTNRITVGPLLADDDTDVAAFRLFRLDENGGRALIGAAVIGMDDHIGVREDEPGTYRYAVTAIDLAGNESEQVEFDVPVSGMGCSATALSSTTAPASLALLLFGAALTMRRCASRPSPARRRAR